MPLAIGSLPHGDPGRALDLCLGTLPEIAFWPQLPNRGPDESMYAQFAEGLPGLIRRSGGEIRCDRGAPGFEKELEQLYAAHLAWPPGSGSPPDPDVASISAGAAAGLHALLRVDPALVAGRTAVKGQVTGPVSFGLAVTADGGRPLLYDDVLREAYCLLLRLKAGWQEWSLASLGLSVIMFLDEPYMTTYGSAYFNYGPELVGEMLDTIADGLRATLGIHCCGNTDWSLVLGGPARIVSFDAYSHAAAFALYPEEIALHLERGGFLAWGIVPSLPEDLAAECLDSLARRFEEAVGALTARGLSRDQLLRRCFITPSCGLRGQDEAGAERALSYCSRLARLLRGEPPGSN